MTEIPFKPTDVVQVRSGGPRMTVTQVGERLGEPTVWCVWFDGVKKHEGTFSPAALRIVPLTPRRRAIRVAF